MDAEYVSPILNHLWQSTVLAAAIGVLVLLLRKVQARFRYALWLVASVKFLVPFALFVAVGSWMQSPRALPVVHTQWSAAVTQASRTFTEPATFIAAPMAASHAADTNWVVPIALIWAVGFAVVTGLWFIRWHRLRAMVRAARPLAITLPIPALSSPSLLEPSVFGISKPVLLLPERIEERLSTAQLTAVYAHELCHVRRRDNLAAALHMLVEALFWFHPLVWWLEGRLIEERERACDEAVLQAGNHPQDYAESILEVCKLCLASPLTCTSGVSGADLKKRIETIMSCRIGRRLNTPRKLLLAVAGGLALVVPVVIGVLNPAREQEQPSQTFEVVSIKPSDPAERNVMVGFWPNGRFQTKNATLRMLIDDSFQVHDFQVEGLPKWADSEKYDIEAKAEIPSELTSQEGQISAAGMKLNRARIRTVLTDRFRLKFHTETKDMPVYYLVGSNSGPKLEHSAPAQKDYKKFRGLRTRPGELTGADAEIGLLTNYLSTQMVRVVIDKTGLTGRYDFTLHYTPERPMGPLSGANLGAAPEMKLSDSDANEPTLVTALQEQLGLKLQSAKGPVDVLVIDRIERPSPN